METVNDNYNLGKSLYNSQEFEKAITVFDKTIETLADVLFYKAECYHALKNFDESLTWYKNTLEIKADHAGAKGKVELIKNTNTDTWHYNYGMNFYRNEKFGEALASFDKAIEINPKFADAIFYKGGCYHSLRNYKEALVWYQKAFEADPDHKKAQEKSDALIKYLNSPASDTQSAEYNYTEGTFLHNKLKYKEALEYYEKALTLKPDYAEAQYYKGVALQALGRNQECLDAYRKAVQLDPSNTLYLVATGAWARHMGFDEEALDYLNKAFELRNQIPKDEKKVDTYERYIATTLEKERPSLLDKLHKVPKTEAGEPELIAKPARSFSEKSEDMSVEDMVHIQNELWHHDKGMEFYNTGKYEEALTEFNKAIEINPKYADALFYKGGSYHSLKNYKEALVWYQKALEANPDHKQAKIQVEALSKYLNSPASDPNSAEYIYGEGCTLHNKGNYEEALACYEKALKIKPDYVDAQYYKGVALQALGRKEECLEAYRKAIQLDPNNILHLVAAGAWARHMGLDEEALGYFNKAFELKSKISKEETKEDVYEKYIIDTLGKERTDLLEKMNQISKLEVSDPELKTKQQELISKASQSFSDKGKDMEIGDMIQELHAFHGVLTGQPGKVEEKQEN